MTQQRTKLARYEKLAAANAAAQTSILAALDGALDTLATLTSVAGDQRGRVADQLAAAKRIVASTDLAPHPGAVDMLSEDAA